MRQAAWRLLARSKIIAQISREACRPFTVGTGRAVSLRVAVEAHRAEANPSPWCVCYAGLRSARGTRSWEPPNVEAERARSPHRRAPLLRGDAHLLARAAAMQVRAEFAGGTLPLHRGHNSVADHQRADIGRVGLLDELLHQDVDVNALKGLDHRLRRFRRLAEQHADALGAFQQLYDDRRAADKIDDILGLAWVVGEGRDGESDAASGKQLKAAELVARAANGNRF